MAESTGLFRAVFGSTAILGCAVLGVSAVSSTYAGTNFNKAQCKMINSNGAIKGLAIAGSAVNACYCISTSGRRIPRPLPGSVGQEQCFENLTPQKTVNFNLNPPGTPDTPGVEPEPNPNPGPTGRRDNGWGNGPDPENPGSFHGNGVAQGGPGAGQTQTASKNSDPDQR
jgi:hypothetical protein